MSLKPPPNPSVFPDRRQVTAALARAAARAAARARIIAEQTGTQLIVVSPPSKPAAPAPKPQ